MITMPRATVSDTSRGGTGAAETPVLDLRGIGKSYGSIRAVDGISFTVQPGEVFTLLGPSGCGKSTTLRIVAGLEHPEEGSLTLRGRTIVSAAEGIFLPAEKRNMGMVFQSYAIWPHMTVFENVAFPVQLRRWPKQKIQSAVSEVLDLVGLGGLEQRPATRLSGGQQQRVALARALVYRPDILLLDEPLSNLDAKLREYMRIELRSLQRRLGIAVLFVTHDQGEAMAMSDRVAVMSNGRVEQIGTPEEVYERPRTSFVRDFLGRAIVLRCVVRRQAESAWLELVEQPGTRLRVTGAQLESHADGDPVVLSFRPEGAELALAGSAGEGAIRATVEEALYLGERVEYRVRTHSDHRFLISGPRYRRYSIGDALDLVVNPTDVLVWPATTALAAPSESDVI